MKFAKGDKVRITSPACVSDSPFHNAEGFVRCYEGSGVWVDVPTLGEHYANEARLTLVRRALRVGDSVKVVSDCAYAGWVGVVDDVNDDPADDEPYEVYFEFCDGYDFFRREELDADHGEEGTK